jgi:hypothetical protein
MLSFDPNITAGAVLNAVVLLVGFVVAFTRIGGRLDLLSLRVSSLEESIKTNAEHGRRLTVQEERQTNLVTMVATLQREISSLRRGEGWIQRHRDSVDGEYDEGK